MNRPRIVSGILTALILLTASCAGIEARRNVLIPTMRIVWPSIKKYVQRGIDASSTPAKALVLKAMERMALMLKGEAPASSVRWLLLKTVALLGIDAMLSSNEIGPGVAESLREGVRLFDESFRKL